LSSPSSPATNDTTAPPSTAACIAFYGDILAFLRRTALFGQMLSFGNADPGQQCRDVDGR
jgi:hypothetical protein